MSTVPTSIFPNTTLKLNELEAVAQPQGVHPKHLMRLCNQREVSSIIELRQTLPRCVWPQLVPFVFEVPSYMGNFFDNVASGIIKYAPETVLTTTWSGTPQHNVFRIAIILTEPPFSQYVTDELLKEQDEYWARLMRSRLEYYADIVESILLFRLLYERSVPLLGVPRSYTGVFASLTQAILQAEAGTENAYFMIDAIRYAVAMRQSPMRLGNVAYLIYNQETPKFNVVPVALRPFLTTFAQQAIGYSDYLVKTTTRYYINKFRIEPIRRQFPENNLYKVMYERYVSYEFPIFTGTTNTHTWAFRVSIQNAIDAVVLDDLGGSLGPSDQGSILSAASTTF